ncbi:DMT family transporter [Metabacillus iocasae]|uniref:Transporter family-2 protein n=1 Tax=Priestia iocasae TaxID=2291674 RepID=A0ABS2QTW3_9BACI|nr:DMT family transporter [Metabacillus iocasae]MBM7702884.1 transporter family-2 protein [Metabacillus iocasae]
MSMVMLIGAIIGGIVLSAQSSINGAFSNRVGTIQGVFFTFFTGMVFLTIAVVFFGQGNITMIFEVPKWQLTAALLGITYLILIILAVPKIGVTAANIATIIGQLVAGMVIDHFGWFGGLQISLDTERVLAMIFMLLALYFIFKSNKQSHVNAS